MGFLESASTAFFRSVSASSYFFCRTRRRARDACTEVSDGAFDAAAAKCVSESASRFKWSRRSPRYASDSPSERVAEAMDLGSAWIVSFDVTFIIGHEERLRM